MKKKTTIGLIQTKVFENQNKNLENSIKKIKSAANVTPTPFARTIVASVDDKTASGFKRNNL